MANSQSDRSILKRKNTQLLKSSQIGGSYKHSEGDFELWEPPITMLEEENAYYIFLDIPRVETQSIKLSIEENRLTISGKNHPIPSTSNQFIISELPRGFFLREVKLPKSADMNQISGELAEGVLKIQILKLENLQFSNKKLEQKKD